MAGFVLLPGVAAGADATSVVLFSSTTPGFVPAAAVVPAGICAVELTVAGGPGGAGLDDTEAPAGGAGAVVTAMAVVSPGEVLDAEVAGAGQSAGSGTDSYGYTGYAGAGGVGGGGGGGYDFGRTNGDGSFSYAGGGGGGASAVSAAGTALVVAGGGGGGGDGSGTVGGAGELLGMDGDSSGYGGSATGGNPYLGEGGTDPSGGEGGSTYPNGTLNAGSGTVGGGGDGSGDLSGRSTEVDEIGGQGSGAPGAGYPVEQGPLGFGGAGNTTGGDGGYAGYPVGSSHSQGGGGGGGGVGFGGGGGGEAGGGGAGYAGGFGSTGNDPSGGGGGSSFVAPTVDGGSALSSLATGEVTISYDPVNDVCGLTTLYASATAAPASGGGASVADPADLAEALLRVPAGGTVFLISPGGATAVSRYVGNWSVTTPGTSPSSRVTIEPLPGLATQPILDGDGPDAPAGEVCQTPLIPTGQFWDDPYGFPSCIGAVLTVAAGVHVDLEGTTIADGSYGTFIPQGSGGGLTADGPVMVSDDSFIDNDGDHNGAYGPIGAAAISVGGAASVTVTSSTFTGNSNVDDNYWGGAISNVSGGTLSVTGSTFTGNTDPEGLGGAIATTTPTPITDSTFTDNSAERGGAVDGDASITNSTFTDNSASTGGAIYGASTVSDSTFSANTATGNGGALYGASTVSDSTFSANTAANSGGALAGGAFTVTGSTFSANTATGNGGAIYGASTVSDSTFAANTATDGGAVYGGSLTVTESTFAANTADDGEALYSSTTEVAADIFSGSCDQAGGTWVDDGYNAGTDATCFGSPPPATDVHRPHLDLRALAANGGPTQTVVPRPASPAIGLIPASTTVTINGTPVALCPTVDQRGDPSTPGAACNAGSVQTAPAVPLPTVTAVSPDKGPTTGGQFVTITGTGFLAGDTVEIGQGRGPGPSAVAATNVTVVSPTEITATTGGPAKAGTWKLFVITPTGHSHGNQQDRYRYQKS